jgi:hypothetical protein
VLVLCAIRAEMRAFKNGLFSNPLFSFI